MFRYNSNMVVDNMELDDDMGDNHCSHQFLSNLVVKNHDGYQTVHTEYICDTCGANLTDDIKDSEAEDRLMELIGE